MTVAIIGGGHGYRTVIDYADDEDVALWAVSSIYPALQSYPIDRVYEIHKEEKWKTFNYTALGDKLVLPYSSATCPYARVSPVTDLGKRYGILFSSTVSWMVASALDEKVEELIFLGVDMEAYSEYGQQRDGLFFLLGQARAMGVEITIPEDSQINIFGQQYGV